LFPVDFSKTSEATARYVRALAELTGATVTLLHAVPWLSGWYAVTELRPPVIGDEGLCDLKKHQMTALEMFRETHFLGWRCFSRVEDGALAETIADTAQEIGADLITMPTRGLGPSRRF
jgi:nucleotide-binding universal stress UspA family protein